MPDREDYEAAWDTWVAQFRLHRPETSALGWYSADDLRRAFLAGVAAYDRLLLAEIVERTAAIQRDIGAMRDDMEQES